MSKSKRLMELMLVINQKREFTVRELAREFAVSRRTILRDLQELSEIGVPLYSEVGPHGGYRVLKQRLLPPIAFSEEEAVAIFFAIHALRHYSSLPFEMESSSALGKFYSHMPLDVRNRIDQMKNRIDFESPARLTCSPYLAVLLDAAIDQQLLLIDYESREKRSTREIQPIGIYTRQGLWYCPAYCCRSEQIRLFRCDRILSVERSAASASKPPNLKHINLENIDWRRCEEQESTVAVKAELTQEGVQACEGEPWSGSMLHIRKDGSGWLEGNMATSDLSYFARFFIGLGHEVTIQSPPELLERIQCQLSGLMEKYDPSSHT